MKLLSKILVVAVVLSIMLDALQLNVLSEEEIKKVLFISSYHASFDTLPDQVKGLQSVFEGTNVKLDIDYMDTNRQNTDENYENYYSFLKYRIDHDEKYDVVLVGDDNGLQFLLDNREELFSDIPVVFFCINDIKRAELANSKPLTTGIIEGISIDTNLELALQLFPETTSIVGIVDNTNTGIGDANMFLEASTRYPDQEFKLLNSSEYSFDAFGKEINKLEKNTLIFYLSMFQDNNGQIISISEAVNILNEYAKVPIFRMSVGGVGEGVFGGNMVSYMEQGRLAAEMAMAIIQGENPDQIRMIQDSPNVNFFDYNKMKHYNIHLNKIPSNSVVINKPINYYEKYKAVLIPFFLSVTILSSFILLLFRDNKKLKTKDKQLRENNVELASLYEEMAASEEELRYQYDTLMTSQKALNESEERYRRLAYTDTLTELNNRPALLDFLKKYVQSVNKKWCLLYIDLDNFKYINDSRGHEVGDEILRIIGQRLKSFHQEFVYLSRLGGDEFVIIVDGSNDLKEVSKFAGKLIDSIKLVIEVNQMMFYISCSVGISLYPNDGTEENVLLRKADMAMYKAKSEGRSRFVFFDKQMEINFLDKMMIQNRIRYAIENNEFELYFQPQYDIKHNYMCGSEALLRWQDSSQQFISPDIFIPIAEEQGTIGLIGNWVFNEAARNGAIWQNKVDVLVKISVNVSASELVEKDFAINFVNIVEKQGFSCKQIAIEITEGILIHSKERAIEELMILRTFGIEIHLDDFGSGFSSLKYMVDLPLDIIKIDRSFIKDITIEERNKNMAKFIIDISHQFNLKVIAEGVETKEQFDLLKEMECDIIQGFYYGKPMNVTALEAFYLSTIECES